MDPKTDNHSQIQITYRTTWPMTIAQCYCSIEKQIEEHQTKQLAFKNRHYILLKLNQTIRNQIAQAKNTIMSMKHQLNQHPFFENLLRVCTAILTLKNKSYNQYRHTISHSLTQLTWCSDNDVGSFLAASVVIKTSCLIKHALAI